jgi:hypothetical protein
MQDVIYVVVVIVFFVLSGLFVVACDRIIGPDEEALAEANKGEEPPAAPEKVAA